MPKSNPSGEVGVCSECDEKKNLTRHGTCWPCHLRGVNLNTRIEARLPKGGSGDNR